MKWGSVLLLTLVLGLPATLARAEGGAMVVGIASGGAERSADRSAWTPLRVGDRVDPGTWIRTGKDGAVRLLGDDGALLRIGSGQEQVWTGQAAGTPSAGKRDPLAILRELFGRQARDRVAGVRGPLEDRWGALMNLPDIPAARLDEVLEVASEMNDPSLWGLRTALFRKVVRDHPDEKGLAELAAEADLVLGTKPILTISVQGETAGNTLGEGAILRKTDKVRLTYVAPTRSIPYVFIYTPLAQGGGVSERLYPPRNESRPRFVDGGDTLTLPNSSGFYSSSGDAGPLIVWAWACAVPVDAAEESAFRAETERVIQAKAAFPEGDIQAAAPEVCIRSFRGAYQRR